MLEMLRPVVLTAGPGGAGAPGGGESGDQGLRPEELASSKSLQKGTHT